MRKIKPRASYKNIWKYNSKCSTLRSTRKDHDKSPRRQRFLPYRATSTCQPLQYKLDTSHNERPVSSNQGDLSSHARVRGGKASQWHSKILICIESDTPWSHETLTFGCYIQTPWIPCVKDENGSGFLKKTSKVSCEKKLCKSAATLLKTRCNVGKIVHCDLKCRRYKASTHYIYAIAGYGHTNRETHELTFAWFELRGWHVGALAGCLPSICAAPTGNRDCSRRLHWRRQETNNVCVRSQSRTVQCEYPSTHSFGGYLSYKLKLHPRTGLSAFHARGPKNHFWLWWKGKLFHLVIFALFGFL